MINVFTGEFLFHPCPIEISGNTCSHNCIYCFANIRKTRRECKLKSILNYLKTDSNKTYLKSLIHEGYPICFSNKTDPFSKNNYIQTLSIFEHLMALKNGVFIQTKGGYGIDETLRIIGPRRDVVWYITCTTLKDEIRRKVEPGAPDTETRLQLAEKLHKMGFMVIIALNPLVEEWLPMSDIDIILNRLKKVGIKHIIHEPLHINKKEAETFGKEKREIYGEKVLTDACNLTNNRQYSRNVNEYLIKNGFSVFKLGMPFGTELFNDIRKKIPLIFPNNWDFINDVIASKKTGPREVKFSDYLKAITKYNKDFFYKPFNGAQMYLIRHAFNQWKGNDEAQNINTLVDVLRFHWNNKQCRTSM
jgi:DNA repair photolyase